MSDKPLVMGAAGELYQSVFRAITERYKQKNQKLTYRLALNRKFKPKRRPTR